MLLNQDDRTEALPTPAETAQGDGSPVVEVVAGWDPAADADADVIVACRTAAGVWYLADTHAAISASLIASLTGQTAPPSEPS
jgi:hypothetical protein